MINLQIFNFKYAFINSKLNFINRDINSIDAVNANQILNLRYPQLVKSRNINLLASENVSISTSINVDKDSSKQLDSTYIYEATKDNSINIKKNKNKSKNNKKNRKNSSSHQDDLFTSKGKIPVQISSLKSIKQDKTKLKENNHSIKPVDKNIYINGPYSIEDLSLKLHIPEAQIITYLFLQGFAVTINQMIDESMAKQVAKNYNFNIIKEINHEQIKKNNIVSSTNSTLCTRRPAIITIFGHVDHGKTTLLDCILKTNLVKQEYGGITQEISGYEVKWLYNSLLYDLVFLDTPGHEAFASMRSRGAQVADIALLVVAADDGLKPQSIEAIKYILDMNLPYIVVINKVDKFNTDITKIKEQLMTYDIVSEEFGGDSIIVQVSALKGQNIDLLLSQICILSNTKLFKANPNDLAEGTILESYLDKQKGIISNLIVQNGTLKMGDFIVADSTYCKVKNLINSQNIATKFAKPSSIVKCLGFSALPSAGVHFFVVDSEKKAKQLSINLLRKELSIIPKVIKDNNQFSKKLNVIIKTDTQGSLEAIFRAFSQIPQNKVQINIVAYSLGNISSTDIDLAATTHAVIIGFKIDITAYVINLMKQNTIVFKIFNLIYDLLDFITISMLDLVDIEYDKLVIGSAVVQTVFTINQGSVAGCFVNTGKIKKMSYMVVYRNNNVVYDGILTSLKHLKDDVDEVMNQNECGIMCSYNYWEKLDLIEVYDLKPKKKTL